MFILFLFSVFFLLYVCFMFVFCLISFCFLCVIFLRVMCFYLCSLFIRCLFSVCFLFVLCLFPVCFLFVLCMIYVCVLPFRERKYKVERERTIKSNTHIRITTNHIPNNTHLILIKHENNHI